MTAIDSRAHNWRPIEDLPHGWEALARPEIDNLLTVWNEHEEQLRDKQIYENFVTQLRREWAIETGVIERLYSLSEGATKTLIAQGLDAALLGHDDTDQPAEKVVAMIRDQYLAIEGLYQFVSGARSLSTSYIKELHSVLTKHQATCEAIDSLGNIMQAPLLRGEWKKQPNNIEFADGFRFEFSPPEQVASEMDQLVALHGQHARDGVPPLVEAAWLHHRFTLIHPFQDGNGRVARCLATLVLLRHRWFPLIVTREHRSRYISALRDADQGSLTPLVDLFASLQKRTIFQALELSADVEKYSSNIADVLSSVRKKFRARREEKDRGRQNLLKLGDALQAAAAQRFESLAREIDPIVKEANERFRAVTSGSPSDGPTSHFNRFQIIEAAKSLGYFANLNLFRAWAAIAIDMAERSEILVSLHGIGRRSPDVLACSAIFYQRDRSARDDPDRDSPIANIVPLCSEPFEFTYLEADEDIQKRFRTWLESAIQAGLECWRDSI
ncbi:MAG: Fic family protein [Phycisphaerales bacterium]